MRIRANSVFVSSALFTVALVCLVPAFWANVLTARDQIWLAKLDAGYRASAGAMSDLSVACLAVILIGLIVMMDGIHRACSLVMGCDVCRRLGVGIPAFGVAGVRGTVQGQDGLHVARVASQRNLPAGLSTNLGGVGSDFLVDGDRATTTDKIVLLLEGNTGAKSWPIDQTHCLLRHRYFGRYDCTICLDTRWRPVPDFTHRVEFGAAITFTTGAPHVDSSQNSVTGISI
jgi:hypothetical protein